MQALTQRAGDGVGLAQAFGPHTEDKGLRGNDGAAVDTGLDR